MEEQQYITEEEYWALEVDSPVKHEYYNGDIYAMAGGSHEHALIAANAILALGSRLRGKRCRAVSSDQHVKIEATGLNTYPDVTVFCQPARFDPNHQDTLLNPTVLIEVLSPSTRNYDKGDKFDHYKQITSLRDYLLISTDKMQVQHYHRLENGDWLLHTADNGEATIALESIDADLPLNELYETVTFPDEPRRLREPLV